MKLNIMHSEVQDTTVIKFGNLDDYYKVLNFLDDCSLPYTPLTYSSRKDTASIRVNEITLDIVCKKYGVYNCEQ